MEYDDLKQSWTRKYDVVPAQLQKLKEVPAAATAFNTNIDAIVKIKGETLKDLILANGLSVDDLQNIHLSGFKTATDTLIGIVKCFSRGIAEEWITDDLSIYKWIEENLGYERLQMGGQGGIIANVLALLGVNQVVAHANSLPKLQAEQFLDLDNLIGIDENGKPQKATAIARPLDIPLIHWIIEFDKGDSFSIGDVTFTCPKSNRFIATYDPLNMKLVMNPGFVNYLNSHSIPYLLLSGFHPLQEKNNGVQLIKDAVPVLQRWQQQNPQMIIHLEIASTQDEVIRKAIVDNVVPCVQSVGLNERETIDLLNILGKEELAQQIENDTCSNLLFEAILFLKEKLKVKRIQLHMFGLYMTILDDDCRISPEQTLNGMMTASVVSSSKAYNGELAHYEDVTKALGIPVSDQGLKELSSLSRAVNNEDLLDCGMCRIGNYWLCAIPTIIVERPKTLVGMGDTISSVSLLAAR